jgi:uncharacterized protein YndB with AHSA1/START domain
MNSDRIEKSITLKAPVSRVWKAISDYREFGVWFRVDLEGPFVVGKTTRGRVTYPGYEHIVWEAEIKVIEAERRFAFSWHPGSEDPKFDYSKEPSTLVEFRLEAKGAETLLTLTESGFDRLPAARRDEAFRLNDGGWTEQMKNIEAHVSQR